MPLGTLDVRQYLYEVQNHAVDSPTLTVPGKTDFPTCGPDHRFSAILFIEKEGFLPLFKAVHLAERYDLAIMSTKGLSVTASRRLVDELCGESGIRLLVLHDFDKAGFSILGTFQRDTRRYEFENYVEVIDLGLRLADVQAYNLAAESVSYGKSDPKWNLRKNGVIQDEIQFLCGHSTYSGYSGQRVELNAFPSDQLIEWLETKLKQHGVQKMIPDAERLGEAYRRALEVEILQRHAEKITEEAREKARGGEGLQNPGP